MSALALVGRGGGGEKEGAGKEPLRGGGGKKRGCTCACVCVCVCALVCAHVCVVCLHVPDVTSLEAPSSVLSAQTT